MKTFTIGFNEKGYNEAVHAKAVAQHLGTDHTELYLSPQDGLNTIPRLSKIWDEPFADSSQIPTLLLSEMTRRHVVVSLSGDAGDELFGGYHRYVLGMRIWKTLSRCPLPVRRLIGSMLMAPALASGAGRVASLLPKLRNLQIADRLPKVGQIAGERYPEDLYRRLVSHLDNPEKLVIDGHEPLDRIKPPSFDDFRQTMMYLDTVSYLPDDILAKVDRASMAVSLESRVPFLDHRVVEFAWRIPMAAKFRDGVGKNILREVLYRYVPKSLVERPKMGFGVPIDSWLRGPLRGWAEDLLDEGRLRREGNLHPGPIRQMWEENLAGRRRWHYQLWDVLMFQAWHADNALSVAAKTPAKPLEIATG